MSEGRREARNVQSTNGSTADEQGWQAPVELSAAEEEILYARALVAAVNI